MRATTTEAMSARREIRVVDLSPEHEPAYLRCLAGDDEYGPSAAGAHKARWVAHARERGLRVKLALDGAGRPAGMIQSVPIELAPARGRDLEFILCVWVPGHGRDEAARGMGTALLRAAEEDARARGVKGMAAWGLWLPFWMRASWFRRRGYRRADRRGLAALVWKPFVPGAEPPRWLERTGKRPEPVPGKVAITGCVNGWCPAQNVVFERAVRAAAGFGERVECRRVDTIDRAAMEEWGEADALFVDGRRVGSGPPLAEAKLVKLIGARVRRLERAPPRR